MKNIKTLLVLPFFFYATEGYLKAFQVNKTTGAVKLFVICNFLICLGLILADFQFFGNTDADGFYTQAVLAELLYLAGGAGLNLFSELETR
ncbi:hypothetical protein SKC37_09450 [Aquirufa sp. HETE-83D]|uniref:DoxX family protein n=1 Tax=Aquirufa esocilacus TaxID=3096513 RepID=A0ABW6DMA8_9BACT